MATAVRLFAENGFDGVSLRAIASEAAAHLALIHYHFGSKEDLYRAIWAARYSGGWRAQMYASLDYSLPREELLLQLVDIFLRPVASLMDDQNNRAFLQILAHEMGDSKEAQRGVLRDYLDFPGRQVIAAFQRALPEVPATDIAWGFQFSAGAFLLHVMDVARITRVSDGAAKSGDIDSAYPRMRAFILGGWLEIARRYRSLSNEVGTFPWRVDQQELARRDGEDGVEAPTASTSPVQTSTLPSRRRTVTRGRKRATSRRKQSRA